MKTNDSDQAAEWRVHLGRNVGELRELAGFTQDQLAERSNLAQSSISEIENGRTDPAGYTLHRLAVGLCVSVAELYRGFSEVVDREGRPVRGCCLADTGDDDGGSNKDSVD